MLKSQWPKGHRIGRGVAIGTNPLFLCPLLRAAEIPFRRILDASAVCKDAVERDFRRARVMAIPVNGHQYLSLENFALPLPLAARKSTRPLFFLLCACKRPRPTKDGVLQIRQTVSCHILVVTDRLSGSYFEKYSPDEVMLTIRGADCSAISSGYCQR